MLAKLTAQAAIAETTTRARSAIAYVKPAFAEVHLPAPPAPNASPGQLLVQAKHLGIDPIAEIRAIRTKAARRLKAATEPLTNALAVAVWLESVAAFLREPFSGAPTPEPPKEVPDSVVAALTALIEGARAGTIDLNSIADELELAADASVNLLTDEIKNFRRFQSVLSIAVNTEASKFADTLNDRFPSASFKALADGLRKRAGRMKTIHRTRAATYGKTASQRIIRKTGTTRPTPLTRYNGR